MFLQFLSEEGQHLGRISTSSIDGVREDGANAMGNHFLYVGASRGGTDERSLPNGIARGKDWPLARWERFDGENPLSDPAASCNGNGQEILLSMDVIFNAKDSSPRLLGESPYLNTFGRGRFSEDEGWRGAWGEVDFLRCSHRGDHEPIFFVLI